MHTKQKPRLDRRNAIKNIDYDASVSSSSLSSPSRSSFESPPVHKTRSLDSSRLSDRTSFRIEGIDGEFDLICRSLGLSGPEDFAISAAAWESHKASTPSTRFSSTSNLINRSVERGLSDSSEDKVTVSNLNNGIKHEFGRTELTNGKTEEDMDLYSNNDEVKCEDDDGTCAAASESEGLDLSSGASVSEDEPRVDELQNDVLLGKAEASDEAGTSTTRAYRDVEGGIKGVRPPLLAPPPVKSRSVVDNLSSTWDIFRDFAPPDDGELGSPVRHQMNQVDGGSDGEEEPKGMTGSSGNNRVVSETSSVTSNDENENDDNYAISPVTEIVGSLSSDGPFRRSINKSWQKGDFLGSGSFGTVYEGFTE